MTRGRVEQGREPIFANLGVVVEEEEEWCAGGPDPSVDRGAEPAAAADRDDPDLGPSLHGLPDAAVVTRLVVGDDDLEGTARGVFEDRGEAAEEDVAQVVGDDDGDERGHSGGASVLLS